MFPHSLPLGEHPINSLRKPLRVQRTPSVVLRANRQQVVVEIKLELRMDVLVPVDDVGHGLLAQRDIQFELLLVEAGLRARGFAAAAHCVSL